VENNVFRFEETPLGSSRLNGFRDDGVRCKRGTSPTCAILISLCECIQSGSQSMTFCLFFFDFFLCVIYAAFKDHIFKFNLRQYFHDIGTYLRLFVLLWRYKFLLFFSNENHPFLLCLHFLVVKFSEHIQTQNSND